MNKPYENLERIVVELNLIHTDNVHIQPEKVDTPEGNLDLNDYFQRNICELTLFKSGAAKVIIGNFKYALTTDLAEQMVSKDGTPYRFLLYQKENNPIL